MDKQTEQARELLAEQRQQEELRQEAMLIRAEEELQGSPPSTVEEKARLAMASQLQEAELTQEAMLERSEEELHQ
ncbi:MAG TPA: hypothetical protein IGR64_08425 [Leptolyngbyaceae cyanobacterium M65_K2018_010]|nr:hypothetical protein [Leptolyngbyaceae cyanobacterium M65_K2018_010]